MSDNQQNQEVLNANQFEGPKSEETIERQEALGQKFEAEFKDKLEESGISNELISKISGLYQLRGDLESDTIEENIIREAIEQVYSGADEATKNELLLEINSIFRSQEIDENWVDTNETIENNHVYSKIEETFGQEVALNVLEHMSVEGNIITALTIALNINSINGGEKRQDSQFENVIIEQNRAKFDNVFDIEKIENTPNINLRDLEEIKGFFFIEDDLVLEIVDSGLPGNELPRETYEKILNAINLAFSIAISRLMESHGNVITTELVERTEILYNNNTSFEERMLIFSEIKEETLQIPGILKSTKRGQIERFRQIEELQRKARAEKLTNPILIAKENLKRENEQKYLQEKNNIEEELVKIQNEILETESNIEVSPEIMGNISELLNTINGHIASSDNSDDIPLDYILSQI